MGFIFDRANCSVHFAYTHQSVFEKLNEFCRTLLVSTTTWKLVNTKVQRKPRASWRGVSRRLLLPIWTWTCRAEGCGGRWPVRLCNCHQMKSAQATRREQ